MSADLLPRRLYYVPIVHTQEDLGSLAESAQAQTTARLGAAAWEEKQRAGAEYWERVASWVDALPSELPGFRLYQDGLPVCGSEDRIVAELADKGSRNYRLLTRLMQRGAVLMGTESPNLLREEYELVQQLLAESRVPPPHNPAELLARRDGFIALRIAQTLLPGETGILFIGALHRVAPLLPSDIQISYPLAPRSSGG
ncbi:MAG TPA: hypothetical protein PLW65_33670 [Pseudomonadota bacterium]|nr:hypothetical protein [Pseudomonadota bacterium]